MPKVVMISLWRDDMNKRIEERVKHLLSKSYPNLRFVWVVGDSADDTEYYLWQVAENDERVKVVRFDVGVQSEEPNLRLEIMSLTANAGLQAVEDGDDYVMIHESDLISPVDVVEQFIATGKDVVGGWVTLNDFFYDSYVYRKDGVRFSNHHPYHVCYKADEPFELDSIGSCWMFRKPSPMVSCLKTGALELCEQLKAGGYTIWCNPQIHIIQPSDLWTSRGHASA